MSPARSPRRLTSDIRDRDRDRDRDQNRRRRLHDALPLETSRTSDAKPEVKDANDKSGRKAVELSETANPTGVPRSRSFSQRDDRGTAAQDGRRSERRLTSDHGKWKDSRDVERAARRTAGANLIEKEKPNARGGDSRNWRHDRFFEEKNADPPAKKRRQFREEKLPLESKPANDVTAVPSKDIQHPNSTTATERLEERYRTHRPLERNDSDRPFVKSRPLFNRERGERTDMPPRNRFNNGGEYDNRYRGRDNFGGRQGYQSGSGGRVEKWKHDLYDEANASPTKIEEDPVAKVEALLSL
ncbi:uncharacterized protein LOC141610768 [Silene latifolia]|uniref:uncharacterized protein LOC141610768 n=1 Tax=Silene latifolia TaxID=37657 RepID=UPI003D783F76